jgi:non-specific protein-tyrosine kinase
MEKLRKAIEMAKKDKERETPLEEPRSRVESRDITGKVSPVYSRSQSIPVDPSILIKNRLVCISSDSQEVEFYKILRTRILQRTRPNNWNTIMITSSLPGEGKTITAINLALTFSREFNHTVLLVDCDFRHQQIHKMMGIQSERSLIDAILDDTPLQDLIIWPGIEKLTIISGSRTIRDTSEILSSSKMKSLVSEIKSRYNDRYIFFDLPPVLSVADAIAFSPMVDSILMVVMAEKTSIKDIKRALDHIPKEKFLGFVLNRYKIPARENPTGKYYSKIDL